MGKYYIRSNTLQITLSKKDVLEAAISGFLLTNKFDILDEYFYIDERGYRDYVTADGHTCVLHTSHILKDAGWSIE